MPALLNQTLIAFACLALTGTAEATTYGLGAGGSPVERIYLGYLLGLAGALPATAGVFALLNVMFCHAGRSKILQALIGAALGSVAYVVCVLIGSVTLGMFLDDDNLMQGYAQYGEVGFWWLVFAVLYLPALPIAFWSVRHARSAPKALRSGKGG
jgi:hypothetical protein